jgi:NADH:ubiquinone oxidoreductase subunit 6 (subunit J)
MERPESRLMQAVRVYPYAVAECVVYFGAILILILCYGMVGRSLYNSIKESQALKAGTKA